MGSGPYSVESRALNGTWRASGWGMGATGAWRMYRARVADYGEDRVRIKKDGAVVTIEEVEFAAQSGEQAA